VSQLTLEEKVNLTTGTGWQLDRCVGQTGSIPRLGFRAMCLQDSPLGIRFADLVSAFSSGVNVAATWDRGLAYAQGAAMGYEHRNKGVDYQLGPVAGPLGRTPEGGRNWEGYSPDPVLTAAMFAQTIKGIQSQNVMTNLKHFIGNEQEHFRQMPEANGFGYNISEPASANIDDVTMHELYLWPFAEGIRAGAASVMCSYNQINGSQSCQNSYTLNHLLKGELGFQGPVISDWLATHSGVSSVLAGLDMTMPGDSDAYNNGYTYFGSNLTIAVLNGTVPAWRLDDMAMRIMAGYYKVDVEAEGRKETNFHSWTPDSYDYEHWYVGKGWTQVNDHVNVRADHGALIRHIGARSTVLLKNVNNTLPLSGKEPLTTVFGEDAGPNPRGPNGCENRGCDDGTLAMGWGSGTAEFPYLVTPDTAIQNTVLENGGSYESSFDNYDLDTIGALARRSNVSIVFANSHAGETFIQIDGNLGDRNNLTFWQGADDAIATVAGNCSNTVLVVHSVGPILLEEYKNNPNITAILWAGLPGQESGNAIADVLFGRVNPGAKLPWTIGKDRKDYGTDILYNDNDDGGVPQLNFQEGNIIDYRAFDLHNKTPTYEFGFGLSYTTFAYSDLEIVNLNASAYVPNTGYTSAAPTFGNFSKDPADHTFPSNFTRIPLYHYSWLNQSDLARASGDLNYGSTDFIPEGALNGSAQPVHKAGGAPGGNPSLYDVLFRVYATIKNTGSIIGEEVPQLYLSRGGPYDPVKELRGFERLSIAPNATTRVSFDITRKDIASWNTVEQDWIVQNTTKNVWVGSSSRNLPLSGVLA
jgi:beta-glucosidase